MTPWCVAAGGTRKRATQRGNTQKNRRRDGCALTPSPPSLLSLSPLLPSQAIPTNLARYGLSQVVNHLLGSEAEPTPFDFLVAGTLVRGPLDATLRALRASAEATVDIEYTLALAPPTPAEGEGEGDGAGDWVTALDGCLGPACVVSGGANGRVLLWVGEGSAAAASKKKGGAAPTAAAPCPTSPVTAAVSHAGGVDALATVVHPSGAGPAGLLLSAGKDGRVVLSLEPRLAAAAGAVAAAAASAPPSATAGLVLARYVGHTAAVAALAVAPGAADRFASAGWDGPVRLWRCDASVATDAVAAAADAPPSKKVRRGGGAGDGADAAAAAATSTEEEARPVLELDGHTQAVAALAWGSGDSLVSGSWDHTLRRWDAEAGRAASTLHTGAAVFCVAVPPGPAGAALAAFGGAGGLVRLWDERASATAPSRTLASHAGWVAGAAWHPTSPHLFATAGHDGAVKLWDVRAGGGGDGEADDSAAALPAPALHTLAGHGGKVCAVAWAGPGRLVSGGEDGRVRAWDVQGVV